MKYRPEIDGLRAIAVISVILFHASIPGFQGGFVGVDIFFVISGYLITTLILNDLRDGKFSLLNFWERRARRILPPLIAILAISIPFAWHFMLPAELKDYGQSLVAVAFFSANILFWRENSYFAGPADEKPLLHTWSLAVEEQFYLLFPLLLLLIWRQHRFWLWVGMLALISFVASDWATQFAPNAGFFLLPFRAWELLAGSLAAIWLSGQTRPVKSDAMVALGIILIAVSMLTLSGASAFPGRAALLPVAGTLLIILFAQGNSTLRKALSHRLIVGVGLISYSLYLWHQPIFAFLRLRNFGHLDPAHVLFSLPIIGFLAWASWKYIEQPWRRPSARRSVLFSTMAVSLSVFVGIGVTLHLANGAPGRLPAPALQQLARIETGGMPCHDVDHAAYLKLGQFCRLGDPDAPVTMLLLGDSHAGHLAASLDAFGRANGQAFGSLTASWCTPLLGMETDAPSRGTECDELMQAGWAQLDATPQIELVILAAQWTNFTTGGRFGVAPVAYFDAESNYVSIAQNPSVFTRATKRTADRLRLIGRRVVIVGPVPEYEIHMPKELARVLWRQKKIPDNQFLSKTLYESRAASVNTIFSTSDPIFTALVDPGKIFCVLGTCRVAGPDGEPYYRDPSHLSEAGADLIVAQIAKLMKD